MTSLYVKLIVRAIMNFRGSHEYSIIKNLLALPIAYGYSNYHGFFTLETSNLYSLLSQTSEFRSLFVYL